jgi:hypothetical protein
MMFTGNGRTEGMLFSFLEAYLQRLEGPISVQVWSPALSFVRDFLANPSAHRQHVFPSLRCFTALSEKVSQTSALEDRRLRRELQVTSPRLSQRIIPPG